MFCKRTFVHPIKFMLPYSQSMINKQQMLMMLVVAVALMMMMRRRHMNQGYVNAYGPGGPIDPVYIPDQEDLRDWRIYRPGYRPPYPTGLKIRKTPYIYGL